MSKLAAVLSIMAVFAAALFAQTDRGVVTGTVKDPSGAVIAGATVDVVLSTTNTASKTTTNASGEYTVAALPVGTYQVRVENPGFKTFVQDNVVLNGGETVRADAVLEVGTSQQTVEVSANAVQVETESARVATQVSSTLVDDLPVVVNGAVRSPYDLAATTADAAGTGADFHIGGGRAGSYGITLDGTSVGVAAASSQSTFTLINTPSVEALTEFNIDSGGFKAETGHASGGTLSFVSKSGTNDFHGDLYEFLRNTDFDARNFFAAQPSVLKQNDFGATAGGPVWIPKVYKGKDKTFFFASYEGFRNRVGATPTPLSVPPPQFFSGNLQDWVNANGVQYTVYDPNSTALVNGVYTRTPFPNNQIPLSRIDPIAMAISKYVEPLVVPNVPNLVPGTSAYVRNNYISYGTTAAPQNKLGFKFDQVLTSKQRLSFFYGRNRELDQIGANGPTGLPAPLSGNPGFNRSDVYRINYTYTITPTLLNSFTAGGNNWEQNHGGTGTTTGSPQSQGLPTVNTNYKALGICIPGYPDCNVNFPEINFGSDFTAWGVASPNGSSNIVVEFRDDMTKTHGTHTFKWGFYYNNTHYDGFGEQNIAGNVTFNDDGTSVPLSTNIATGGGSAFASFLLGYGSGYSLDTPRFIAAQYRTPQMYAQDDWHVSQKLTVNIGLRYEINLAPTEGSTPEQLSNLSLTLPNPAAGNLPGALVFAGTGPGTCNCKSLAPNWYGGVGPRVGFSYALNNKTVIRGAATRSFGPVISETASGSHYLGFDVRTTATDTSQGLNPLVTLSQGVPPPPTLPSYNPSIGNGVNAPFYNGQSATKGSDEINFAFNIQRQFWTNAVADIGYVGLMASDIQSALLDFNQLNLATLPADVNPFTAAGRTLLNSLVGSAAANAAGITAPFPGFNALWGTAATVAQALRPYPQYSTIDTTDGGGDRLGHSTYNGLQLKFTKRYAGLTVQTSYVYSKLLTDSDNGTGSPENAADLRLEKSIGSYDQTHNFKVNYAYDLPFGSGKLYLSSDKVASAILGGWRIAAIQSYSSGEPIALTTTISFPFFDGGNRPTITTYDGWGGTYTGKFDPNVDSYLQPASFFGVQSETSLGNATRYNPKFRYPWNLNENASLSRSIKLHKESQRLEFRLETFNLLNRVQFGPLTGALSLQNANFGLFREQANSPRILQLSLKLYF